MFILGVSCVVLCIVTLSDMMGKEAMPKYFMPWLVGMPAETCRALCCMIFGGVFERLPRLKVCFAHGGGGFPATIGRIEQGYLVRPDLCQVNCKTNPRHYVGKIWVDSLVHDEHYLKYLVDTMGPDKVILGSDYPFPRTFIYGSKLILLVGEAEPGKMVQDTNVIDEATKQKILVDNALDFLGLTREEVFNN